MAVLQVEDLISVDDSIDDKLPIDLSSLNIAIYISAHSRLDKMKVSQRWVAPSKLRREVAELRDRILHSHLF